MADPVSYELKGGTAWIHMDDGKANAINGALMAALTAALARAESDGATAVVLAGRLGFFSAGLDLKTLPTLDKDELRETLLGFGEFTLRLLTFPRPVVALSAGHALAGGAVVLLCADWKVGCEGPFKYGLHEVSVGIPMPTMICELGRGLLDPRYLYRSIGHGEIYDPPGALAAGFLDELRPPDEVVRAAEEAAARLASLPGDAFATTKERLARPVVEACRASHIETELEEYFQ